VRVHLLDLLFVSYALPDDETAVLWVLHSIFVVSTVELGDVTETVCVGAHIDRLCSVREVLIAACFPHRFARLDKGIG